MATKTKARKSTVDYAAVLQAIDDLEKSSETVLAYIDRAQSALESVRFQAASISSQQSRLLRLLETSKRGSPPRKRPRSKPAKRSNVDGGMPKGPSVHSRQPKARVRKRVARKQAVEVPRAGKKNIHYLKHGLCVCGMFSSPPVNWPYDHQWAPDWKDVNCPGCLSRKPSGKEFFHGQDIPH